MAAAPDGLYCSTAGTYFTDKASLSCPGRGPARTVHPACCMWAAAAGPASASWPAPLSCLLGRSHPLTTPPPHCALQEDLTDHYRSDFHRSALPSPAAPGNTSCLPTSVPPPLRHLPAPLHRCWNPPAPPLPPGCRYNLKRKIAGLPPVTREWYEARKAQLLATSSAPVQRVWFDPLCKRKFYTENTYQTFIR